MSESGNWHKQLENNEVQRKNGNNKGIEKNKSEVKKYNL